MNSMCALPTYVIAAHLCLEEVLSQQPNPNRLLAGSGKCRLLHHSVPLNQSRQFLLIAAAPKAMCSPWAMCSSAVADRDILYLYELAPVVKAVEEQLQDCSRHALS